MIGIYFNGRIGNNMYQYAYIRTMAEKLGVDFFINLKWSNFDQFNDIFPHLIFNKNVNSNFNYVTEHDSYDIDPKLLSIKDNTIVEGFLQNSNWFNIDDVRKWFDIYLNEKENNEYNKLLELYDPNEYCYINYRGADFIQNNWVTGKDFFTNAQKMTKRKKFVVFTDDIINAKLNIVADEYFQPNYKVCLKLLTQSKELIISAWSTFSWWGAWLSHAELIIQPEVINNRFYVKNDRFKYIYIDDVVNAGPGM